VVRVLDGIDAFLDQLTSVDPLPAFIAVLCQLAYPHTRVPRLQILGAYLSGIGVNAIVPVRAGDAVRIVLAHRAVAGSSYTTIISSTLVLSIFDIAAASTLLLWAAITLDELPGIGELPRLPSFDFAWLLDRPLAAELILAALLIGVGILAYWIHGHVIDFWDRVKQAFTVVRDPAQYLSSVAVWQAADWTLRLVTIWFMFDAFDIPQTIQNVLLVQVSSSLATLLPLTPGGLGTEQAFLLYVFGGVVPNSQLLAFSVGMRLLLLSTNVVAGFTAIALTLRTVRLSHVLEHRKALEQAKDAQGP
jgi:uncharacterized membrane protein YbhN (UPF0104 family)